MAKKTTRSDIIAVLMLADENGGRISADLICKKLLGGEPINAGYRILNLCKYLELISEKNELTDKGRNSIDSENIYIPEGGPYQIICTQDLLLPQKMLDYKEIEDKNLKEIVHKIQDFKKTDNNTNLELDDFIFCDIPKWVLDLKNEVLDLLDSGRKNIQVIEIAERGQIPKNSKLKELKIILNLSSESGNSFEVAGLFNKNLIPPDLNMREIWLELLGEKAEDWDESLNPPRLKFNFDELTELELSSFRKNIVITNPSVSEFGIFEKTIINSVPITAKTQDDAAKWAKFLLINSINDYLNNKEYKTLKSSIIERFSQFSLSLPTQNELAAEIKEQSVQKGGFLPSLYWFLKAPLDLMLEE